MDRQGTPGNTADSLPGSSQLNSAARSRNCCSADRPSRSGIQGRAARSPSLASHTRRTSPSGSGAYCQQNDHAAGRVSRNRMAVEPIAQADIEDTGYHCIDAILRVSVRHQLHARGHFQPDHVRACLRGVADNGCEADRRWERRKWLPVDVLG